MSARAAKGISLLFNLYPDIIGPSTSASLCPWERHLMPSLVFKQSNWGQWNGFTKQLLYRFKIKYNCTWVGNLCGCILSFHLEVVGDPYNTSHQLQHHCLVCTWPIESLLLRFHKRRYTHCRFRIRMSTLDNHY